MHLTVVLIILNNKALYGLNKTYEEEESIMEPSDISPFKRRCLLMREAIHRANREKIRELYYQSPQIITHKTPSLFYLATLYLQEDSLDELCKLWDHYSSTSNQGEQLSSIYSLEERRCTVDWIQKFAAQIDVFDAKNSWTLFDLFKWASDMLAIHNAYAAAMAEAQHTYENSAFGLTTCNIFKLLCWSNTAGLTAAIRSVEINEERKNMLQLDQEQRECIWRKGEQMGGETCHRYIIAEMVQGVKSYAKNIKHFIDFPEKHNQFVLPRLSNNLSASMESLHLTQQLPAKNTQTSDDSDSSAEALTKNIFNHPC